MKSFNPKRKYNPFQPIDLPNRSWPNQQIKKAPIWCSVDLRDGNQALVNPMNYEQKRELYCLLVELGFDEIEIGFPSASDTEYRFTRGLLEEGLIAPNVFPQVLCQAREKLIKRTMEALDGYPRAIFHLYNSTSTLQRRVVFRKSRQEIIDIAVSATQVIKSLAAKSGTNIVLEYSPESFTGTELDFALEICAEVCREWGASPTSKVILNLPATVELATPNIYADQIEFFRNNFPYLDSSIISLHTHNDRGTGVAATELGLLAGAERVEGTLFGNGERTGNLDIVTVALNLYSQGIDPQLNFQDIKQVVEVYERATGMEVPPRHPYAGELVFTAFSGSHQDAIKKGMDAMKESTSPLWEVPYLPIDPSDIGQSYEAIIRINSQSGKGGVAYILQHDYGIVIPKEMFAEFGAVIQAISDESGAEVRSDVIFDSFQREYLKRNSPFSLKSLDLKSEGDDVEIKLHLLSPSGPMSLVGKGNGPIDAAVAGMQASKLTPNFALTYYSQHALSRGSGSEAIAFIEVTREGESFFGVGQDTNTTKASIKALLSAVNRSMTSR